MISKLITPDGTLISTMSPTFFPISPCAIGVLTAILPSFRFASESETKVYVITALFLVFLIFTLFNIWTSFV